MNTLYASAQRGLAVATLNESKVTFYTMPGDNNITNSSLYNVDLIIFKYSGFRKSNAVLPSYK